MSKKKIDRRRFGQLAGGAGLVAVSTTFPFVHIGAAATPRVVVIGGGPGGATVARYIADGGGTSVTLIEANKHYTSCFFSNLYLGGFRTLESLTHSYDMLGDRHDVDVINDTATAVDPDRKRVRIRSGGSLPYDRLVLAPGIDFKFAEIEGYGPEATVTMPHAYKAGPQTALLKRQLLDMRDGGVFVITPPANPYRCPPGPYERVSMVAHYFKHHKPKSTIVILDAKDKFSKQNLFEQGWARFYPGMIEWLPREFTGGVKAVDTASMTVMVEGEAIKADVANIIPPQHAGNIAKMAGVTDESGWCPVHAENLESRIVPGIHVVGDSIIPGDMPKSAFAANSQAKVCANAVLSALTDSKKIPARFQNTCWSLIAANHGVKIGASYRPTDEKIEKTSGFLSKLDEDDATRAANAEEANGWYAGISKEVFG